MRTFELPFVVTSIPLDTAVKNTTFPHTAALIFMPSSDLAVVGGRFKRDDNVSPSIEFSMSVLEKNQMLKTLGSQEL